MNVPSGSSASISVTDPPRSQAAKPSAPSNEPKPAAPTVSSPRNTSTSSSNAAADVQIGVRREEKIGSSFWWTHADLCLLAVLATLALVLLTAYWIRVTHWGTVAVEIERLKERQIDYRLDVNSATWVEWTQLDGIGDALARRIVADREANGPFSSLDDLRRVKGIGPKTLEKIRPWLTIDPVASSEPTSARSKHAVLTGR